MTVHTTTRLSVLATLGVAVSGMFAPAAHGAFVFPDWDRPADDTTALETRTTYQHWADFLGSPAGPNAPDAADLTPAGTADLFDAAHPASGSFTTSGGNIYSPSGVIEPRIVVPGFDEEDRTLVTRFQIQLRTWGQDIDTDDVLLNGDSVTDLPDLEYTELDREAQEGGGFPADIVAHRWIFTAPFTAEAFHIDFGYGVTSSSLMEASVDTQVIPEPASLALLGLGCLVALTRRTRHRT